MKYPTAPRRSHATYWYVRATILAPGQTLATQRRNGTIIHAAIIQTTSRRGALWLYVKNFPRYDSLALITIRPLLNSEFWLLNNPLAGLETITDPNENPTATSAEPEPLPSAVHAAKAATVRTS